MIIAIVNLRTRNWKHFWDGLERLNTRLEEEISKTPLINQGLVAIFDHP